MPCRPCKARLLLKSEKAKILRYCPFTIQLLYGSSGYRQEVRIGVDIGAKHVGLAVASGERVLTKGQINLRTDVKKLLDTRRMLRRSRRQRKTRYRQARFLNRAKSKKQGWLPPSIKSRVDNTIRWIQKFYGLLPDCQLIIEAAKFDIQKIERPEISGVEYQQGNLYQYRNRIAYLLARESGMCQYCGKGYEKGNGWRLHHIWGKEKDRAQDWALVHEICHTQLHVEHKESVLRKKKSKSYKEATFMNVIRKRLFTAFPEAEFTYGNITFQDRCDLGLEKSHTNDAIAITGIKKIKKIDDSIFLINQFRKKKRSLHEATPRRGRRAKNIASKRNVKNIGHRGEFFLNDKVKICNQVGFISGFTNSGCYAKNIFGNYITLADKNYRQISLALAKPMQHNNNWQFIPHLKEGDFLPKQIKILTGCELIKCN